MASDKGRDWTPLDNDLCIHVAVRFVYAISMSWQDMFIMCECIRGGKATDISVCFVIVG